MSEPAETRTWFADAPLGEEPPAETVVPELPCWWCGAEDAPWAYEASGRVGWVARTDVTLPRFCFACERCHSILGDDPSVRLVENTITHNRAMTETWLVSCMFVASLAGPPRRREELR